jgi:hypothetical protein
MEHNRIKILQGFLQMKAAKSRRPSLNFRRIIEQLLHNWPAKIISLVAAIILFQIYRMSTLEERFFSVPLNIKTNGQLVPASDWPRMVRVTLRGESNSIYPVLEDDIEAILDLSKIREEGVYKAPVIIRKKGTAAGIDPLEVHVEPIDVSLSIEHRSEKMIPVTPSFRGYVENGYELNSWSVEPVMVTVSGPSSRISRLEDITTDVVELGGRREDFSARVKLLNLDPLIRITGEGAVTFTGKILESTIVKDFDRLPVVITGLDSRFSASLSTNYASIKIQGSWSTLNGYEPGASLISLDCSSINAVGEYMIPLLVSVLPGHTVLRYDPLEILVVVSDSHDAEDR